jgi:ABC-type bacteriocin/lantibiotic exporter with double-glycine peptidase domain
MAHQVFIIVGIIIIGVLLVMGHQMSLGQFVSAEIVASGIVYSLSKLNKFLENHYSIIVSLLKLELVKKDIDV